MLEQPFTALAQGSQRTTQATVQKKPARFPKCTMDAQHETLVRLFGHHSQDRGKIILPESVTIYSGRFKFHDVTEKQRNHIFPGQRNKDGNNLCSKIMQISHDVLLHPPPNPPFPTPRFQGAHALHIPNISPTNELHQSS